MRQILSVPLLSITGLALVLGACSSQKATEPSTPIVQSVNTQVLSSDKPSLTPDVPQSIALSVSTVVDKQSILSQEFLYGADLQYSSLYDSGMDLYNQSMAIGHIPASFRIFGDELQLITNDKRRYPSEVNHPEQLIMRFKILAQTETTLTLSSGDSRLFLASIFQGTHDDTKGGLTAPISAPPMDYWVRSFEFIPNGNYLLQQTSIQLGDGKGTVAEFMESIFPRSSLAAGDQFEKILMDPQNPGGGEGGLFERFRFLASEKVFDGETQLAYGSHFDTSITPSNPEGTIDWYVTRNIPDTALEPVQLAVEGWNRYFKKFKGIERSVVRFRGRLPEGIHLGDPRFNVINWDSRLVAGAAYESQASDPATGKQSHSLIYMPAAWFQIGFDYWKNGQFSDDSPLESVAPRALEGRGIVSKAKIACLRDIRAGAELAVSGRLAKKDDVKEFGIKLLKGTLFHEVGHAMGLAHNFKGSLSFDRTKAAAIFSTSIMDYNDFEIESKAFADLHSADGPSLEYDRQIMSALYNKSADYSNSDPVVPKCNDAEADNEDGGVDPLCIRYDIESDPTLSVATALDRVRLATKAGDVTLAQSLNRVTTLFLTDETLAAVKTKDDFKTLTQKLASSIKGSMKFYFVTGKASVSRVVRTNVKSLLQFAEDVLPDTYDADEMRERAFAGIQQTLALRSLPESVKTSLAGVEKMASETLEKTPYAQSLGSEERSKTKELVTQTIHKMAMSMETDESNGLPKLRSTVLSTLARHDKVPFFFGKIGQQLTNYEAAMVGILADSVTNGLGDSTALPLTSSERLKAATALASFSGRPEGEDAITAVRSKLRKLRTSADDNESRELIESLLGAI
ncbi:zinc-dependent metalloprotease [Bdellovibrionota bacterium FG-1]